MERPRVFHIAKLGSSRLIYPRSSPCSPASAINAFGDAMAPLASSEPDITSVGVKTNSSPAVTSGSASVVTSSVTSSRIPSVNMSSFTPTSRPSTVTLLREPSRRSSTMPSPSSGSYNDLTKSNGISPLVNGTCTIPRYAGDYKGRGTERPQRQLESQQNYKPKNTSQTLPSKCIPSPQHVSPRAVENTHAKSNSVPQFSHVGHCKTRQEHVTNSRMPVASTNMPNNSTANGDSQRSKRPSRGNESGLPRRTANKQVTQVVRPQATSNGHFQGQSSPQQIRKVLQSSPAYSQYQSHGQRSSSPSLCGSVNSINTLKNCSDSCGSLSNGPYIYTRSETSLLDGTTLHTSTTVTVSHSSASSTTRTSVYSEQRYLSSSKSTNACDAPTSNKRLMNTPSAQRSGRPSVLSLSNKAHVANGNNGSTHSQQDSRLPQPGSAQHSDGRNSRPQPNRSRIAHPQIPRGSNATPSQRQVTDSQRLVSPKKSSNHRSLPNTPTKRAPCLKPTETQGVNGSSYRANICATVNKGPSNQTSPSHKPNAKDARHKSGFGYGYTCTANASFKRKTNNPPATNSPQRSSHNKNGVTPNLPSMNGDTANTHGNSTYLGVEAEPNEDEAFRSGWKRNSMRMATQGYSSMSDLTKSIDCLILNPESHSLANCEHAHHQNMGSPVFPSNVVYNNRSEANSASHTNRTYKCERSEPLPQYSYNDNEETQQTSHSRTPSAISKCSQKSQPPAPSAVNGIDKCFSDRLQEKSFSIPIKQSYFANNSFILVPGNPGEAEVRQNSYTSSSGSPSSGYSSSPATTRERRHPIDEYYRQQEHHNKIKRRSYYLATSSLSDLNCYLEDIDIGEPPQEFKIRDNSLVSDDEGTHMSSFSSVGEEFSTPESHRRQPSLGQADTSYGSFYSCQSFPTASPLQRLSPPKATTAKKVDQRKSFYDNCQDNNLRLAWSRDHGESEESSTESEYRTASSSGFSERDLNSSSSARRDDRSRSGLLSRHWVRTTPYRHSKHHLPNPGQDYHNRSPQSSSPKSPGQHGRASRQSPQNRPQFGEIMPSPHLSETRKSKESPKPSRKYAPTTSEERQTPKRRVTSPIAWCTAGASNTERRKKAESPDLTEPRRRSNSSPFPSAKVTQRSPRNFPESSTAPSLGNQFHENDQNSAPQVFEQFVPDQIHISLDSLHDDDVDNNWLLSPPRVPPALGRPRRKEYAGFDSQPLPIDSFVSDSSSIYTDNTSVCSSRAPSRSADVDSRSQSRRSSIASSTREFPVCFSSLQNGIVGASSVGTLTPRRQMSEDTICNENDLSYQEHFHSSQRLAGGEGSRDNILQETSQSSASTLTNFSDAVDVENTFPERQRSRSLGSSRRSASMGCKTQSNFQGQSLRSAVSTQSQRPTLPNNSIFRSGARNLTKAQSCLPERRTSDASSSSCSRKSSTSGVSSSSHSSGQHRLPRYQQQSSQPNLQKEEPLKDIHTGSYHQEARFPPKRKYFSSRDIIDLLITPEKSTGNVGATSLSTLERQAQKVCRAILCCSTDLSRRVPQREFHI